MLYKNESDNYNFRTDLAIEIREKYEEDNVEIKGVEIYESFDESKSVKTTIVDIVNEHGAKCMGRDIGRYITIENVGVYDSCLYDETGLIDTIINELKAMDIRLEKNILIVGLGNNQITPDALGPLVVKKINVTRNIVRDIGVTAIAPGVMGQTGMEAREIILALVKEIEIGLVIVIDALAARSIHRLNNTIQITNTGIAPGAGVGNNRAEINENSIGVPVIAIGVPTVVDAFSIVNDIIENFLEKEGCREEEIKGFLDKIKKDNIHNMFVTSKNVDILIEKISEIVANGINDFICTI